MIHDIKLASLIYLPPSHPSKMETPISIESIPAGFPSPAAEYAVDYLDFNEYLIHNPPATITVRCGGESMNDAGINKDDLLIIDRSATPRHMDVVLADLGNEYTIKRLHVLAKGQYEPHSENSKVNYPSFYCRGEEGFSVIGVVMFVIKAFRS